MTRYLYRLISGVMILMLLASAGCRRAGKSPVAPSVPEESISQSAASEQARFDALMEDLFNEVLSRDRITAHFLLLHPGDRGIDVSEAVWPDFSEEAFESSREMSRRFLADIASFTPENLTQEQQLTLRMAQYALETDLSEDSCDLLMQPLSPLFGLQTQLPVELSEYRFDGPEDVDTVIAYVENLGPLFDQLVDFEKRRIDAGLPADDRTLGRIVDSCNPYLVRAENNILVQTLPEKLDALPGLSEEDKKSYRKRMLKAVRDSLIPAYTKLVDDLKDLTGQRTVFQGLSSYPGGREHYAWLIRSECGLSDSPEELKARVAQRLTEDMTGIAALVDGSPELAGLEMQAGKGLDSPESIIRYQEKRLEGHFPDIGQISFRVKYVPEPLRNVLSPAFYYIPPLDGEAENTVYINTDPGTDPVPLFSTLAHEGYPGHLYQTNYYLKSHPVPVRYLLAPTGYSEGWGLYAQIYSFLLDDSLTPDEQQMLVRQEAAMSALYALLDIHIHYDGWGFAETEAFLAEEFGIVDEDVAAEVYGLIVDEPANYLKYYAGYLEITDMLQTARESLGSSFSELEFHRFILDMYGAAFPVIREEFAKWLERKTF